MFSSFSAEGLLAHMVTLFSIFLGATRLFSIVCTSLHRHQQQMSVPFSPQLLQHLLSLVLLIIAILTGVRWYLMVVLICVSQIANEVEHLFHLPVHHLYVYLGEVSVQVPCPFFFSLFFFILIFIF